MYATGMRCETGEWRSKVNQKRAEMEELLKKILKEDYLISYDEINKSQIGAKWLNAALDWSTEENGRDLREGLDYAMKKLGFLKNAPETYYKKIFNLNDSDIKEINKAQSALIEYCEKNNFYFVSNIMELRSTFYAEKNINCNGEDRRFIMYTSFTKEENKNVAVWFTMSDSKMPELRFDGETPEAAVRSAEEKIAAYGINKLIEMAYWDSVMKKLEGQQRLREEMTAPKGPGM